MNAPLQPGRFARLDSHHRIFWSTLAGILAYLLIGSMLMPSSRLIAAWDVFAVVELGLAWTVFFRAHPQEVRRNARLQDTGRTAIFLLVILAACAAFIAVAFVLGPSGGSEALTLHLTLSILAIVTSWVLMHTVFALRYAHLYYSGSGEQIVGHQQGLQFPDERLPDFLDFAYFSFVVGMTCQVSDVQITRKPLRRLALVHGVISFVFNTMILALTINVISNLIQRP